MAPENKQDCCPRLMIFQDYEVCQIYSSGTEEPTAVLSEITIIPDEHVRTLDILPLSENCTKMLQSFEASVGKNNTITLDEESLSDPFGPFIYSMLIYSLNIINTDLKQEAQAVRKSETNFITKYLSSFIQKIAFCFPDRITIRWDTSSSAYDDANIKRRPDWVMTTINGIELGCGEVKPPAANVALVDEDRCSFPDHLKRQLHKRMHTVVNEDELIAFGIFSFGEELELSTMKFAQGKYEYEIVKCLKLPTMTTTYIQMKETLESLLGFFNLMADSIKEDTGSSSVSLFDRYKVYMHPTFTFV